MKVPKKTPGNKVRKIAAAAGVALIVGASVAGRSGSALQTPENSHDFSDGSVSVEEEFGDFVHGAIEKNSASKNFGEWESSGFTPEDIIGNAAARRGGKKQAFAALCAALGTVDDAGLSLFQNELIKPEVRAELPCARDLSMRLSSYWDSRRAALQAEIDHEHMSHPEFAEKDEQGPLPSDEVHVDTSKGETLYGSAREGYLKPGEIVISIDDGPHPTITRKVLNTLKMYGVRANFFSVGRPAKVWPDLDKAEIAEGHITGSHTMTHPDLAKLDIKSAEAEITGARKTVADAAGEAIPFFRFPYGSHNGVLDAFVKQQQMTSFLWNMDSEDWKRPDPTDLFHNEVAQLNNAKGGIILMHDIHQQTAIALPHLLDELRHRGWKTVVFVPH